jgi:type VI secretion system protein ImpJ
MAWKNKTIWSEGLFVKPVHFQQQERYIEHYIAQLNDYNSKYSWGFSELTVDQDLLNIGKLAITSAKGIMPDGTPFDIPGNAAAPQPIDVEEGVLDQLAYLCLPVRSLNKEYREDEGDSGIYRYQSFQDDICDVASNAQQSNLVQVAKLNFTLLKQEDKRSDYACLAVSHIIECNKDKQVVINKRFIAPALDALQSQRLKNYLDELATLLEHRSSNLSARVTASGTGGASEVSDFMLLQILNRNIPLFRHLKSLPRLHPEEFYKHAVQLAGELATFSDPRKPQPFNPYQHDKLSDSFDDVVSLLKEQLSSVIDPQSINIPLKDPKYGIYRGLISDPSLINTHSFVLAVKANIPAEEIRKVFPNQVKITSVEKIRELIMSGLAGVEITALPVTPRKIPYHSGYVYFQLNRDSNTWQDLQNSSGFALHISGEYSGLELEFWAVKE